MFHGRIELVIFVREIINAERYRNRCVKNILIPFAVNFGNSFVLIMTMLTAPG